MRSCGSADAAADGIAVTLGSIGSDESDGGLGCKTGASRRAGAIGIRDGATTLSPLALVATTDGSTSTTAM